MCAKDSRPAADRLTVRVRWSRLLLAEDGDAAGGQAQAEAAERVAAVSRTQAGAQAHAHLAAEVAAAVGAAARFLPGWDARLARLQTHGCAC